VAFAERCKRAGWVLMQYNDAPCEAYALTLAVPSSPVP